MLQALKVTVFVLSFSFFMPICFAEAKTPVLQKGGRVFVHETSNKMVKIHTYMAPYKAAGNASHIIELKDRLIIVDMQFVKDFAEEFRAYIDSLHKPIDRVFLSHEHPDHWMGAIAFQDAKIYALPETITYIEEKGKTILKAKNKPGKVPDFTGPVQLGSEKISDITFEFSRVKDTESGSALLIAIPEFKTLIAQDLLYNGTHLFLGNDDILVWKERLESLKSQYGEFEYFLCGHGAPASSTAIFDDNIHYLTEANIAFSSFDKDPKKIQSTLVDKFPELKVRYFVPFGVKKVIDNRNEHK